MIQLPYKFDLLFILLITFCCSCSPPKKAQRMLNYSDDCLESYLLFTKHLKRGKESGLMEFFPPTSETYQNLLFSYEDNFSCWLSTLTENTVIKFFGEPHVRGVGHVNGDVRLVYYIYSGKCPSLEKVGVLASQKCGSLSFSFNKEGKPFGGHFSGF